MAVFVHRVAVSRSELNRLTSAGSSTTIKLPFTIPCAIDSGDAGPVYHALRARNREVLRAMSANKKFVAVQKGISVRIINFGALSMIIVDGRPPHRPGVCFVPAYVVQVIRQHTSP